MCPSPVGIRGRGGQRQKHHGTSIRAQSVFSLHETDLQIHFWQNYSPWLSCLSSLEWSLLSEFRKEDVWKIEVRE